RCGACPSVRESSAEYSTIRGKTDRREESARLRRGRKSGIIFFMREALWWHADSDEKILCTLCPRYCRIGAGQAGFCYIRKNIDGKLYSLVHRLRHRPDREKAAQSLFSRQRNPELRHGRLQPGLPLLPELEHQQGQAR